MKEIRVGLVGISGYAGMELVRLLAQHPVFKLKMACSRAESGKKLGEYYSFLKDLPGSEVEICEFEPERACSECDLVFLAVPAGTAMEMAPDLLAGGVKVIDFSADFRLLDPELYKEWYNLPHTSPHILPMAVYGLPEINSTRIAQASLVANPGCYPTAAILALFAALQHDLIFTDDLIIDAKSGASGAGRKAAIQTLFCEVSDNFRPYGAPRHRHTPEIEQELSLIAGKKLRLSFVPHLVPMKRGILSAIYTKLKRASFSIDEIHKLFTDIWVDYHWVRVLPPGTLPETINVRGSMFCDIGLALDERTNRLIIFSAIDNLCRGASGQALANANLMCGLPMDTGMKDLCPLV